VHGFAHQAGGTVKAESAVGAGTRVTLYLPRATETSSEPQEEAQESHEPGTGTVLLVEDNPEVASASAGLLEQLGYAVRCVADADAALLALERDRDIDLVFSDIVMPGRMDGVALARAVQQKHPGMPVLLATGYSEAAQDAEPEFPILRKPYRSGELGAAVGRLLILRGGSPRRNNLVTFRRGKRGRKPDAEKTDG
jgi:CheY-like chemotaxis protein